MVLKVYVKILLIAYFMQLSFDNFILADELFAKALRSLETCVLVNNYLRGKLFSSLESPTTFDEIFFNVTSVPFFIPDLKYFYSSL